MRKADDSPIFSHNRCYIYLCQYKRLLKSIAPLPGSREDQLVAARRCRDKLGLSVAVQIDRVRPRYESIRYYGTMMFRGVEFQVPRLLGRWWLRQRVRGQGERSHASAAKAKGRRWQGKNAGRTFWNVMGPSLRSETNTVHTESSKTPKSRLYILARSHFSFQCQRRRAALLNKSAGGTVLSALYNGKSDKICIGNHFFPAANFCSRATRDSSSILRIVSTALVSWPAMCFQVLCSRLISLSALQTALLHCRVGERVRCQRSGCGVGECLVIIGEREPGWAGSRGKRPYLEPRAESNLPGEIALGNALNRFDEAEAVPDGRARPAQRPRSRAPSE